LYQKLVKRGPTIDEQKLDTAEETFINQLRPALNTDETYQDMAKEAWTQTIALALQDIQADLGEVSFLQQAMKNLTRRWRNTLC